jgi:hypothetical protein
MTVKRVKIIGFVAFWGAVLSAFAQTNVLYQNDFEKAEVGKLPEEFLVLDGAFAVKQEGSNKFLELPGSPLESYGVQFGPAEVSDLAVTARINGTAKGRRFPTFAVGLNGVAGYKLQLSPSKKMLELYKEQTLKSSFAYEWKSGIWTHFRLQVRKVKEGEWRVEGKAWMEGTKEPAGWMVTFDEKETPVSGKASVFGSPFSGTPIQFDDLVVTEVKKKA